METGTENLSRDETFPDEPPRVSIFDHGTALLGTDPPTGRERLDLLNTSWAALKTRRGWQEPRVSSASRSMSACLANGFSAFGDPPLRNR